jgi:uncharacterized membrane protein YhdT
MEISTKVRPPRLIQAPKKVISSLPVWFELPCVALTVSFHLIRVS